MTDENPDLPDEDRPRLTGPGDERPEPSDDRWSGFGALADAGISDGVEGIHRQLNGELRREVDD